MSQPVNKTMIGLFVAGAIALAVVAVGVLGSGRFFKDRFRYVMVFEGSVKGLNVGAPVVFRGVKIGQVSDIRMHFDYATKAMTILVYADFEPGQVQAVNFDLESAKTLGKDVHNVVMRELIGRGLRARLEVQSIVTGQLQLSLDFHPDKPALYADLDTQLPEIPTIPTPLQELAKRLESLPIEEIINKIDLAMDGIAKLVASPELKETVANLNPTLKDLQRLIGNVDAQVKALSGKMTETLRDAQTLLKQVDSQVASLGPNLNEAIGDIRKLSQNADGGVDDVRVNLVDMMSTATEAVKKAEKIMEELQSTAKADSVLIYRVTESLREVEKSARSLRALTDYLERHPEALLRGKGDAGGK